MDRSGFYSHVGAGNELGNNTTRSYVFLDRNKTRAVRLVISRCEKENLE